MCARSGSSECPAGCGHEYVRKTQKVFPAMGGRTPFLIIQITSYVFGAISWKKVVVFILGAPQQDSIHIQQGEQPCEEAWKWATSKTCWQSIFIQSLSHVQLFANPWAVTCQAPLSMGYPRQEYWSGLPFPSPGDLLDPGIEPRSPGLQADCLLSEPPVKAMLSTYIPQVLPNAQIFSNL